MCPQLFADRFVQTDRGRMLDLATGLDVTVKPAPAADRASLDRWMRRCAALLDLHCPSLVALVDFGTAGHDRRFEVLGCRQPCACWSHRDAETARTLVSLVASLHARGLFAGSLDWSRVIEVGGLPMVVPDADTGVSIDRPPSGGDGAGDPMVRETELLARMLTACPRGEGARRPGVARPRCEPRDTRRDASEAVRVRLRDVLETGTSGRPRAVSVRVPEGSPLLNVVARECRLHGYIPVGEPMLRREEQLVGRRALFDLLADRHVAVLQRDPGSDDGSGAAGFLMQLALVSDRPHVLLVMHTDGSFTYQASTRRGIALREHEAAYAGADGAPALRLAGGARGRESPKPHARVAAALEIAARGRHAAAVRALRESVGMLARRDDRCGAAASQLALGKILLSRGHVDEAAKAFEEARAAFDAAGLPSRAVAAAVFVALAWTDAGRWLEAEAAVRAALIAANTIGDARGAFFAGLALARCLLWQERYRESLDALPPDDPAGQPLCRVSEAIESSPLATSPWADDLDPRVARAALAARIAVGRDDLRQAGAAAAGGRERATLTRCPTDVAVACTALARVYAALGDIDALRRQVREGVDAARRAHAPLRALRLRVVLADGLLRAGKATEARSIVVRLSHLDLRGLPVVLQRPVAQLLGTKRDGRSSDGHVHVGTGQARDGTPAAVTRSDVIEAVVEVLGLCQSIDDDEALARRVMASVRTRARAVVAAAFGLDESGVVAIAVEGREPLPTDVARRSAETGLVIAPSSTTSGLEAAMPVRLGGRTVGALACRWPADAPPDWAACGAVLAATGAAIAPCLRGALDRRAAPPVPAAGPTGEIVGVSAAVQALRGEIARAADAPFNVVIEGESGSGKELVARAIHRLGPRRHHRLCAINCAALTDELLEAELFGHARGAFTGAIAERKGLFEEADGGSLVLDEIGELTPRAQAKLLRAIQEGEIRRLGENFARPVDVRVVAASNRPLRAAADAGAFRRDLLYRLEVIRIVVPPLRERVDDIAVLAALFWQQATARLHSRATLAPATLAALARYDWPGNVRELQNVMAALAVAAGRRGSIGPERLPDIIARQATDGEASTLDEARRVFEARFVRAALARAGGRRTQAARDLGLTRQGLSKLLVRLDIAVPEIGAGGAAT